MKTKFTIVTSIICVLTLVLSLTACVPSQLAGESTLLGEPKTVERVDYSALNTDEYKAFKNSVEAFASDFAAYTYADYDNQDNFAVSPISVYMALALTAECANGDTRQEILNALGVTYEQLQANFATLYRSLNVERKADDKTTGLVRLANAIWVNQGTDAKQPCIESLSNNYYAYSYSADFARNNDEANKAVRDFVKKQTNGLIDKDFKLSTDTLFALINALYLKTIWNTSGNDLPFARDTYNFTAKDGSVKNVQLLQGEYVDGRAVEFATFTTFYTRTYDGYKIKFLLPKDGYTVDQAFTADNIAAVNSLKDYGYYDESTGIQYSTRVLFPEYKCKYDKDIKEILKDKFDIDLLFKNPYSFSPACDFSTLTDESCYCEKIQHVTDLTVNKTGIEGAAVTVVAMPTESMPMITIEEDFIVNKAFGFIITDWQDVTLFSGVVNNI